MVELVISLLLAFMAVVLVAGFAWFIASAIPYFEMIEANRRHCIEAQADDDEHIGCESWQGER